MEHPGFFDNEGPFSLGAIAAKVGADLIPAEKADTLITDIKPLDKAGTEHLAFLDNPKYLTQFSITAAGACIVSPGNKDKATKAGALLVSADPYRAHAMALGLFYPSALRPTVYGDDVPTNDLIHPSARLEEGAIVEPGAVIGREVHIGRGTRIAAGAVVGFRCHVGRNSYVGANASLIHSIIGDNVIIHQGASLGQDGFGFAMGAQGHLKVAQIGRVIVQNDVEIGACTTIDRGALGDTVIGEGTKIDNQVQIGHNVVIGRHCIIVAQVGISGSTILEDYVVLGGQAGVIGHLRIGAGAKIAANGKVTKEVKAGEILGGAPAIPIRQWKREIATLRRLAVEGKK